MNIRVDKDSGVPVHEQIAAQLAFLIGTGQLIPGARLPSARALAQRLGVHRNTVGMAYRDSILKRLVESRHGRQFAVRTSEAGAAVRAGDIDALIDAVVAEAQRRGYSLRQVYGRLRDAVAAVPPDRVLVLSDDVGMRRLLPMEIAEHVECPVESCSPGELSADPGRGIGAAVVAPPAHIEMIRDVVAPAAPIPITYASADDHLATIRALSRPSLIAVYSVSQYFLDMARKLIAPAVGRRHDVRDELIGPARRSRFGAADLVICDVATYPMLRQHYGSGTVVLHRVVAPSCVGAIAAALTRRQRQRV